MADINQQAQSQVLRFVQQRGNGTTCPSEVARALAREAETPDDWRHYMPAVHAAVDDLHARGDVRLSWKSVTMPERDGPYRIGNGKPESK